MIMKFWKVLYLYESFQKWINHLDHLCSSKLLQRVLWGWGGRLLIFRFFPTPRSLLGPPIY